MADMCITDYVIEGSENELQDLYQKITDVANGNITKIDNTDNAWVGYLVQLLGEDPDSVYCRGWIYDHKYDETKGCIRLSVESAWEELNEVRDVICEHYPSVSICMISEEPGNSVYETNDAEGKYFAERYVLTGEYESNYFTTIDELKKAVSEITKTPIEKLSDFDSIMCECSYYNATRNDKDEHIFIDEFEIID